MQQKTRKSSPADIIAGRARSRGFSVTRLSKETGIASATMHDHMRDPLQFRFWELINISKAIGGFSVPELKALGIMIRPDDEV